MEHVLIKGDYVLTKCQNAFDSKTSYWLSKKGMTVAVYCFSTNSEAELNRQLKNIDGYISYFVDKYEKDNLNPFKKPIAHLIYLLERERKCRMGICEIRRIGLSGKTYDELKEDYSFLESAYAFED